MDWKISAGPAVEPVSLVEAKLHLRVDGSDDDGLINELIKSARIFCEGYQNRAFITQTITLRMDKFTNPIVLPKPPLIAVASIKYLDVDGAQQTVGTGLYDVDITSEPGLVVLGYQDSWPVIRSVHHSVEVIYTAGYGAAASDVPENVKTGIKLLVGHLYEHREEASEVKLENLPFGIRSILSIDRLISV